MAGVLGHKALTDGLFQHVMQIEKRKLDDVQEAALASGIAGVEAARWTIDNTPSALRKGKPNRNWTFKMREALDADVKRNGNTITIRVGWLQTKEQYFLWQEYGTNQPSRELLITPMHALMNGHQAILETLTQWGITTK